MRKVVVGTEVSTSVYNFPPVIAWRKSYVSDFFTLKNFNIDLVFDNLKSVCVYMCFIYLYKSDHILYFQRTLLFVCFFLLYCILLYMCTVESNFVKIFSFSVFWKMYVNNISYIIVCYIWSSSTNFAFSLSIYSNL